MRFGYQSRNGNQLKQNKERHFALIADKEKVSILAHYPALCICHRDLNYFHYYYLFHSLWGWQCHQLVTVMVLMLDIFQLIYVFLCMYFFNMFFTVCLLILRNRWPV